MVILISFSAVRFLTGAADVANDAPPGVQGGGLDQALQCDVTSEQTLFQNAQHQLFVQLAECLRVILDSYNRHERVE